MYSPQAPTKNGLNFGDRVRVVYPPDRGTYGRTGTIIRATYDDDTVIVELDKRFKNSKTYPYSWSELEKVED